MSFVECVAEHRRHRAPWIFRWDRCCCFINVMEASAMNKYLDLLCGLVLPTDLS